MTTRNSLMAFCVALGCASAVLAQAPENGKPPSKPITPPDSLIPAPAPAVAPANCDCSLDHPGCQCTHCGGRGGACPCEDHDVMEWPTTKAYVVAPGEIELESRWEGEFPRAGKPTHDLVEEVEVGLPYRFQLALYQVFEATPEATFKHKGSQVEGRWALANWGEIPLNPTIYAEYKFNDRDPDAYEVKLLLADDLAARWHWALNLSMEQEVRGEREREFSVSQALGYDLAGTPLTIGMEMKFEHKTVAGRRGDPELELAIGPNLQWRPFAGGRLNVSPLFGATASSPRVEAFAVFEIEFGADEAKEERGAPPASGSR